MVSVVFQTTEVLAVDTICAAVNPCNSDGTVTKEFAYGECAPVFEQRCLSELANSINAALSACQTMDDALLAQLSDANRQIAQLKKQLKLTVKRVSRK